MNYTSASFNFGPSLPSKIHRDTNSNADRKKKGKHAKISASVSKETIWAQSLATLGEGEAELESGCPDPLDTGSNLWRERLEIPNVWKTFNGVSLPRRLIWTFLFLFSFGLFMLQTADRIYRLIDPPKSSTVQLAYEPELSFPLMTICPSYKFRDSLLKKFKVDPFGCKPGERYCSWDIPYNLATHTETIIKMCQYKKHYSCSPGTEDSGKWRRTITSLGRCFTFQATEPIRSAGDSNAFEIQVDPLLWDKWGNEGSGIRVFIHDHNEVPLVEITGININHGSAAIFALQVKEFDRVNDLRRNLCETSKNYSQSRCILSCVYDLARYGNKNSENSSCGAPFMQSFDIKACVMRETIESFMQTFDAVINNGTAWNNCNAKCPEPCKQRTYTPITTSLGFTRSNSSLVNITIYFSDMWVEHIVEHWDYDIDEFVADTGGSLNLFLGASFVSIIQFSDYFLTMFAIWASAALPKVKSLRNRGLTATARGTESPRRPQRVNAIEVAW